MLSVLTSSCSSRQAGRYYCTLRPQATTTTHKPQLTSSTREAFARFSLDLDRGRCMPQTKISAQSMHLLHRSSMFSGDGGESAAPHGHGHRRRRRSTVRSPGASQSRRRAELPSCRDMSCGLCRYPSASLGEQGRCTSAEDLISRQLKEWWLPRLCNSFGEALEGLSTEVV
jgi:hypothetical protein